MRIVAVSGSRFFIRKRSRHHPPPRRRSSSRSKTGADARHRIETGGGITPNGLKEKGPEAFRSRAPTLNRRLLPVDCSASVLVHPAHATAGHAMTAAGRFLLVLRNFGDERFGGEQQRRDRRR